MRSLTFIIAFLFCLQPLLSMAEMYMWTDENGVKHFSNVKPGASDDVKTMEEKDTVDESELLRNRERYRRSIEQEARKNQIRDAVEERQEAVDEHNLSVYKSRRDYHQQRAEYYKTLTENEKFDLERAEDRYDEVKRESFSDTRRHRRKLDRYENRVENIETDIELYTEKAEYHEDQAEGFQDKIDRIR